MSRGTLPSASLSIKTMVFHLNSCKIFLWYRNRGFNGWFWSRLLLHHYHFIVYCLCNHDGMPPSALLAINTMVFHLNSCWFLFCYLKQGCNGCLGVAYFYVTNVSYYSASATVMSGGTLPSALLSIKMMVFHLNSCKILFWYPKQGCNGCLRVAYYYITTVS
jgi:hypothetical protein